MEEKVGVGTMQIKNIRCIESSDCILRSWDFR